MRIAAEAHGKINWCLSIRGGRPDGYHELDMLMQGIELSDHMTFERARWLSLSVAGQRLPVGESNLVIRAANALCQAAGRRMGARITLRKRIPTRAGLGGGSADCALTLQCLNRLWALHFSSEQLARMGAALGADVPYCLSGGLCRVQGMGETLAPLPGAPRLPLMLVRVGHGLSTGPVFAQFDQMGLSPEPLDVPALAAALAAGDLARADALARNDLEAPAMALLPEIGETMYRLREAGAALVRMTGSGSTVVAAFREEGEALRAREAFPEAILTWTVGERGGDPA